MKTHHRIIPFILIASLVMLSLACQATGLSKQSLPPTATEEAAQISTNTPEPTDEPTREPTPTEEPTPTDEPTAEPTEVKEEVAIDGFKKYEGKGISIYLPDTYVGGNLSTDLDIIIEQLKKMGPTFEQSAQQIEQNRELFLLWAFDTSNTRFLNNVNITQTPVISAITFNMLMSAMESQFPDTFEVVDTETLDIEGKEVGRMLIHAVINNIGVGEAMYLVKEENMVYAITFATLQEEMDGKLSQFEQSIGTFEAE